jgi:signal-transduction protein with cAMP-binding, CBS, and nucleotidyltransferase domain
MRTPYIFNAAAALLALPGTALAEEVDLPAPVLEWSFYVLLIFALVVAVGIFFKRGKDKRSESMSELLEEHHATIHSVKPEILVTECVSQMNEQKIGAMLVMKDDRLLGIFTERDAITRVIGAGLDPSQTKVSAVMSNHPICITPSTTLDEAMAIVSSQRIRHLPVVQDGQVLGMVSAGDLTHWLVEDRAGKIRELADIAGRRRD